MMTKRISMWSGPRNISTAMMYAFAQRSDTQVFDEPLYGHYLRVTAVSHPGGAEVMAAMNCNGEHVVHETLLGPAEKPVLFFKNMAHHLVELDRRFLQKLDNILLIREPEEMLLSLINQIPEPTLRDTGLKAQVDLLDELIALGQQPIVIDSREVLLNPKELLDKLCDKLEISFDEGMLAWPAGPREFDGVWAKHWYHQVHKSTGFRKYQPKTGELPEHVQSLLKQCREYYEQLFSLALKA